MECAFCDNTQVALKKEYKEFKFRKESFMIAQHYYKCHVCGEEFTTTETDELSIMQVYNQFREKHHILFPEQIKALREKYGLSATKMSEILGFGINSYGKYERGEMPNDSNAALLNLIRESQNFRQLVEEKKDFLQEKEYQKIMKTINRLIAQPSEFSIKKTLFSENSIPNRYCGYAIPNYEKFANMLVYFVGALKPFMVKLNKLMFYADFLNYRTSGASISGYQYKAIQRGPVPVDYDIAFNLIEKDGFLDREYVSFRNGEGAERFIHVKQFDKSLFTETELATMREVANRFKYTPTNEIQQLSHEEPAWQNEIAGRNLIDYQKYAFELEILFSI